MVSLGKFKALVVAKAKMVADRTMEVLKETAGLLNTILEGIMVFLVGGAMYLYSYIMIGEVILTADSITGLNESVVAGMEQGKAAILGGLQLLGIVFMVVGLIVVVRAFLSIYGGTGGGSKY